MQNNDKGLTVWQVTLLALGTVIGGSFFLGSSIAINAAGPGVIISFIIGGLLVYLILFALSEMTVYDVKTGSFRTYCEKMYGPLAGFTVGWMYWTGIVLAMSSESLAVSVFIQQFLPDISLPVLGSSIIIGVTLINLLGVDKLSKIESGLALIKILAIVAFIVIAVMLVFGLFANRSALGLGAITQEPLLSRGIGGIGGSMLIVMFTYAGFEIVGLAAPETKNPAKIIPKAIKFTVFSLTSLYIVSLIFLLPLTPTSILTEEVSPLVISLTQQGLPWAAGVINIVLIIAILSTMLAAMFGIAAMLRSLADEGHAPRFLKDKGDIPYKGITFSGVAMLLGLALGFVLPQQVYRFLVSSGGFAFLFVYLVILLTHFRFRKLYGCPSGDNCQLPGYPYTSIMAILLILGIIVSMPLIPGQGSGLLAGLSFLIIFSVLFIVKAYWGSRNINNHNFWNRMIYFKGQFSWETSKEITEKKSNKQK